MVRILWLPSILDLLVCVVFKKTLTYKTRINKLDVAITKLIQCAVRITSMKIEKGEYVTYHLIN